MSNKEKYNEILKYAKALYEYHQTSDKLKNELVTAFPELRESEDEKIRKELKALVTWAKSYSASGVTMEDAETMLNWLEKQGEIDNCPLEYSTNTVMTDSKKNQVEPKFKVGDWVVTSYDGKVNQVITVDEDGDGFTLDDDTYFSGSWKDGYHLWSIQDAKDGDVLVCNDYPFLFSKYEIDEYGPVCCSYCGISNSDYGEFLINTNTKKYWCDIEFVNPATKEQRDLLFSKMKEAGYEWNAEKKELKKIDNEEYNGEDYGIDGLWHAKNILEETLGKVDGYQSDDGILEHKCAITAIKKLYEQKHAEWSEEDIRNIENIDSVLFYDKDLPEDTCVRLRNWLKSIKDRVQPKQEWSEEDKDYYDAIIAKLEVTQDDAALTDNQMKFLKSLKDRVQSKQEWSEEDEEMVEGLNNCLDELEKENGWCYVYANDKNIKLNKVREWLKSLKEKTIKA